MKRKYEDDPDGETDYPNKVSVSNYQSMVADEASSSISKSVRDEDSSSSSSSDSEPDHYYASTTKLEQDEDSDSTSKSVRDEDSSSSSSSDSEPDHYSASTTKLEQDEDSDSTSKSVRDEDSSSSSSSDSEPDHYSASTTKLEQNEDSDSTSKSVADEDSSSSSSSDSEPDHYSASTHKLEQDEDSGSTSKSVRDEDSSSSSNSERDEDSSSSSSSSSSSDSEPDDYCASTPKLEQDEDSGSTSKSVRDEDSSSSSSNSEPDEYSASSSNLEPDIEMHSTSSSESDWKEDTISTHSELGEDSGSSSEIDSGSDSSSSSELDTDSGSDSSSDSDPGLERLEQRILHLAELNLFAGNHVGALLMKYSEESLKHPDDSFYSRTAQYLRQIKDKEDARLSLKHIESANLLNDETFEDIFRINKITIKRIVDLSRPAKHKLPTHETMNSVLTLLWYLGTDDDLQTGCSIFNLSIDDLEKKIEETAEFIGSTLTEPAEFKVPRGVYSKDRIESPASEKDIFWGILNRFYFQAKNGPDGLMISICEHDRPLFRYIATQTSQTELPKDLLFNLKQAACGLKKSQLISKKILYADASFYVDTQLEALPFSLYVRMVPTQSKVPTLKKGAQTFGTISRRFPRLKLMWRFSPNIIRSAFILHNFCLLNHDSAKYY